MSQASEDDDLQDLPWPKPCAPSSEVSQAIRQQCTKGLCHKRGASAGQRLMAALGISAFTTGLVCWMATTSARPEGAVASGLYGIVGWGIVLTAILALSLGRPPGRRGSVALRVALATLVPLAFFAYLAFAASGRVPFDTFSHGAHAHHAVLCGLVSLVIGAIVAGGVMLCFRRTDPLTPGLSGAIVGLAGGLTSAVAIGVACPSSEAWHLWAAHGLALVALVLLGWGVGRRVLSP
ncbi:MAG TPA: NrsF family protein [Polyangiaceae bacterium]|jgi:hypothetical protein|nr:NrsF family protein [Polyangiaceae bacterium]